MPPTPVDLDDTSNCPLGPRCESCGTDGAGITVCTVDLGPLGVGCFSLCPRCAASDVAPPVTVSAAIRFVIQHHAHLGIDADGNRLR